MRSELKKLNNNFEGLISEIPIDEIKKIYYLKYYDRIRTLWLDNDVEGFKRKEDKLLRFIEKMNPHQRHACFVEEEKAYNKVIYDLRVIMRSESLISICSTIADNWFINRVNDYMDSYDKTGDEYYYKEARRLIKKMNNVHDKLSNPKKIKSMEKYIELLKTNEDLTKQDMDCLDYLTQYTENYHIHADL